MDNVTSLHLSFLLYHEFTYKLALFSDQTSGIVLRATMQNFGFVAKTACDVPRFGSVSNFDMLLFSSVL